MTNGAGIARRVWLFGLAWPFVVTTVHAQTNNTGLGAGSLSNITTGDNNTGIGVNALHLNTTGSDNTATGRGALYRNTSGQWNTAVGVSALYWNTIGNDNTAVGTSALESNTSGGSNIAIGGGTLYSNTTGGGNIAIGTAALTSSNGLANVAVGVASLFDNSTGARNTAVGYAALEDNTTGEGNTAIGFLTMDALSTGGFNTAVGRESGPTGSALSNTGALGYAAHPSASNTVVVGNGAITQIGGSVGWSNLSDGRFKTSVKDNVPGLAFVTKLKPVTFKWELSKLNEFDRVEQFASDPILGEAREAKARKLYTGFIAQDVAAAARECDFDFSGVVAPDNERSPYALSYAEFVVPLVKAVQEQQKEIEELRASVRALASGGEIGSMHAGMLGESGGGMLALIGAVLFGLYLKRSRLSPVASNPTSQHGSGGHS